MSIKVDNRSDNNLKRKALSEILKCTICLKNASSPIFNCIPNGHIVCGICSDKVRQCGLCQSPLDLSVLGEALSKKVDLSATCPNAESGCTKTVKCSKMKGHVANCYFREMICKNGDCAQVGTKYCFSDFRKHLKENHLNDNLHFGRHHNFFYEKQTKNPAWESIKEFDDEIFFIQLFLSGKHKSFFAWVTVFGDPEKAKKYKYNLKVASKDKVKMRVWKFPVLAYHDYSKFKGLSQFIVTVPSKDLFSEILPDKNKLALCVIFDLMVVKDKKEK